MQQGGLTTAEAKRSPLTVVVALSEVLGPGTAALGGGDQVVQQVYSGHVYSDGGEEVEVR